jgi:hypothetical protein
MLRDRGQKPAADLLDPGLICSDVGVSSLEKPALLTADLFALATRSGWPEQAFRGVEAR